MKALVRFLIQKLLEAGLVTRDHFNFDDARKFSLKDDVWLWNMLRNMESDNRFVKMVQEAVFYREKKHVLNLWKTRPVYHRFQDQVVAKTHSSAKVEVTSPYVNHLNQKINVLSLVFNLDFFKPVVLNPEKQTRLYSEPQKRLTGETLIQASRLIEHLPIIRAYEPQYFVILVGHNARMRNKRLAQQWVNVTADWIQSPSLW